MYNCFFFLRKQPGILISKERYKAFLNQEIENIKLKEKVQNKSREMKKLQTQLSYFKMQAEKRKMNFGQQPNDDEERKNVKTSSSV